MTAAEPIVEMHDISISFPGVKALDGVDFRMFPGEVHTLMGENGAGKSTLIKALTGVYQIDSGSIVVGGQRRQFQGTGDRSEERRVGKGWRCRGEGDGYRRSAT